ncbi:MAG: hypothetical protein UHN93_03870, partial [Alistipes sp.]|nr:hypothetical protein [Alistipes sp.]
MKNFRWLMVAMMTLTLSLVACEKDKPEPQPQPQPQPQPVELTFEVETVSVSKNDATFNITPSNLEADYLVVSIKANEVAGSDAEVIGSVYSAIDVYAQANGTTFEAYIADKVKRGALEAHKVENLCAGTDYYLLVFGVDANNGYALTSKLCKHAFQTDANTQPQPSSCTFDVKANVHLTTVALNVKPSDNNQLWHLINVSVEEYQTY